MVLLRLPRDGFEVRFREEVEVVTVVTVEVEEVFFFSESSEEIPKISKIGAGAGAEDTDVEAPLPAV
jgi:hypothetical protein